MNDDLLVQIANHLDAAMRVSSLSTNAQLGQAAGVNVNTVSRILRARNCRISTVGDLATALGLEVQISFVRKP